jgi:hypothetical protein
MASTLKVNQIQTTAGTGGFSVEANPSVFRAYQITQQTIPNNVETTLQYDTVDFDPNNWYSTSTYRFTPTVAGYYQVTATVRYNTGDDWDICDLYIKKNNSLNITTADGHLRYDTNVATGIIYLNGTTDYLHCETLQVSGSSQTLRAYPQDTFFCAHRIIG